MWFLIIIVVGVIIFIFVKKNSGSRSAGKTININSTVQATPEELKELSFNEKIAILKVFKTISRLQSDADETEFKSFDGFSFVLSEFQIDKESFYDKKIDDEIRKFDNNVLVESLDKLNAPTKMWLITTMNIAAANNDKSSDFAMTLASGIGISAKDYTAINQNYAYEILNKSINEERNAELLR